MTGTAANSRWPSTRRTRDALHRDRRGARGVLHLAAAGVEDSGYRADRHGRVPRAGGNGLPVDHQGDRHAAAGRAPGVPYLRVPTGADPRKGCQPSLSSKASKTSRETRAERVYPMRLARSSIRATRAGSIVTVICCFASRLPVELVSASASGAPPMNSATLGFWFIAIFCPVFTLLTYTSFSKVA